MKKVILSASLLVGITATAQTYERRVGVNTNTPNATMDIREIKDGNLLPLTRMQGLSLPNFSTEERAKFTGTDYQAGTAETDATIRPGTLIYNTTKKCIEMYVGYNAGTKTYDWSCLCACPDNGGGTNNNPTTFEGTATLTGTVRIKHPNCPDVIYEDLNYNINVKQNYNVASVEEANRLAQVEANRQLEAQKAQVQQRIDGQTCPVVMPPGASFQSSDHWIVSVKDSNYMPFEKANAPLTGEWTRDSGASKDPLIHFPGIITTAGEEVEVPITVTSAVTLPAGSSRVVVPADKTEDGVSRTLVLEWGNTQLTTTTKTVKMKLRSEGGNLNIMLLDLLKGLGQNGKGVNLATFALPGSATVGVNVIPGIKDSAYGITYGDGKQYHNMVYYPGGITKSGKVMLSTDLGQTGLDPNKPGFDPYRKGTDGYLYAYGKGNDGHEVFIDGNFLFGVQSDDAYQVPERPYEKAELNPCPTGYEPIRYDDFLAVASSLPYLSHDVSTGTHTSGNVPNWTAAPIPRSKWYEGRWQSRRISDGVVAWNELGYGFPRWSKNRQSIAWPEIMDSSSKNGADLALMRCVSK